MILLIVALVLLIVHAIRGRWPRQRHQFFERAFGAAFGLGRRSGLDDRATALVLLAGTFAAAFLVQRWLAAQADTWPWFLFSLVALLLAWGARDLDGDVEHYLAAADGEEARQAAAVLVHSYEKATVSSHAVVKGIFFQALVRWFGVLFWFLLLGAAGAILFRLGHALLASPTVRMGAAEGSRRLLRRMTAFLDLPAAALTVLSLAVVGNFDAVLAAWREEFGTARRSVLDLDRGFLPEVGFRVVLRDVDERALEGDRPPAMVRTAMNLVWRSLLAWLTVLALLVVAGYVS